MLKKMQPAKWLLMILSALLITSLLACVQSDNKAEFISLPQNKIDEVNASYTFPLSLFYLLRHSLEIADTWLMQNQDQDGSWQSDPLLTSFILYAMVEKPGDRPAPELTQSIAKGFAYLKRFIKPDGSFEYNGSRRYLTAAALLAFAAYNQPVYQNTIIKAREYLIQAMNDEGEGYNSADGDYGGLGYGNKPSDLTGTQLALEACKAAGPVTVGQPNAAASDVDFNAYAAKALLFITRCQSTSPDTAGGFSSVMADRRPAQEPNPVCGSMTYTGLKGLLDAGLPLADSRVQNALTWVKNHYTLQADPGLKPAHIYFYYMLMAKALSLTGTNLLVDEKKQKHFWREELADRLISLQKGDGYWQDDTFASQARILDTAYAIMTLRFVLHGLEVKAIQ